MPHTERELEACYVQMLCVGLSGMSGITLDGGGGGGIAFDIVTEDNEPIVTEDEDHIVYNFQVFSLSAYHYGSYVQVYWPHTNLAEDYKLESSSDGENWTVLEAATTDNSYTDNSPPGATAYYRIRPHSTELGNGDYIETLAFAPSSITGNVLWLDASLGTYQSSGGSAAVADGDAVGEWQDQSGNDNHASQSTGGSKPTLQTNELNSLPVVRFDGTDDYLDGLSLARPAAYTVFTVSRRTTDSTGGIVDFNRATNMATFFENSADKFSSSHVNVEAAYSPQTVATWYVTTTRWSGTQLISYLNGEASSATSVSTTLTDNPMTGRIGKLHDGYNLAGDIASVLIFDSALSASNRIKVENYLAAKYGLTNITNFSAANNGPSTVALSWTAVPYASNYTVQRSPDDTTWTTIKELNNTTTYEDTGLADNTTYYYRVRAGSNSYGEWWGWTASESVTTTDPPPVTSGLVLWLDASYETYQSSGGSAAVSDGDAVGEWQDQSGNDNHANQSTGGSKPTLQTNELNGLPVLRFDGTDDQLNIAELTESLPQPVTIFAVFRWAVLTNFFFVHDGVAVDGRASLQNELAADYHIRGSAALLGGTPSTDWVQTTAYYNGASSKFYVGGALTMSGNTGSATVTGLKIGSYYGDGFRMNGDIAAILIYDSALSDVDREAVEAYLINRYGLALQIKNLAANGGTQQIALTWDDAIYATKYEVQRSADGSTGWATLDDTIATSDYTDTGLADSTAYYYRVRAGDISVWGEWSDVVDATTNAAYLLRDTFTDADGTALASHTMDVGGGWTTLNGQAFITSSDKAVATSGSTGDIGPVADAGASDATVSVVIGGTISTGTWPAVTGRVADANNGWAWANTGTGGKLYEKTSGSWTERASASFSSTGAHTFTMTFGGTSIAGLVDGVQRVSYTSSQHQSATKYGLLGHAGQGYNFDNFEVTAL